MIEGLLSLHMAKVSMFMTLIIKKYLDANSGLWNSCAGFDHKGIIEVAKKSI